MTVRSLHFLLLRAEQRRARRALFQAQLLLQLGLVHAQIDRLVVALHLRASVHIQVRKATRGGKTRVSGTREHSFRCLGRLVEELVI